MNHKGTEGTEERKEREIKRLIRERNPVSSSWHQTKIDILKK
jgi:hypothetical protein